MDDLKRDAVTGIPARAPGMRQPGTARMHTVIPEIMECAGAKLTSRTFENPSSFHVSAVRE